RVLSSSLASSGPEPSAPAATVHTTNVASSVLITTDLPPSAARRRAWFRIGARPRRRAAASVFVLEGELHLGAVREHLAVLEVHVERRDLGDAQIAQRLRRLVDGRLRRLLPRVGAGADQLDDLVDALRH